MRKKNICVLTYGDATKPSTWSNVPYLLTKAFEKKGYNIINVDISTKRNIFTLGFNFFIKILSRKTTFYFVKTKLNKFIVERKIKHAVKKYDSVVDFYLSISYDFSPYKYTKKKIMLFSDWPIEYAIERRFERKPDFLEKMDIRNHIEVIKSATYVISLFKDVSEYMKDKYNVNVWYFGGLINGFCEVDDFRNIEDRNGITFIGKKSYIDCAKNLVEAYKQIPDKIKKKYNLNLNIIGLNKDDIKCFDNFVDINFYGYLDKGNETQRKKYYSVLKKSIVNINTSDKWAGMSSMMEAMYYYRPIITSSYDEFVKTFGKDIKFGYYCKNNSKDILNKILLILKLSKKEYQEMCKFSHNEVKNYSYDAYVENLLNLIYKKTFKD